MSKSRILYKRDNRICILTKVLNVIPGVAEMLFTPLSFSIWIAAMADPPVANIGSTTNTSRLAQSAGSLQ